MKNITLFAGILALLAIASCSDNNHEKNNSVDTPVERQQVEPAKPAPPKEPDGTTIRVNDDGVSVKSTSGENKNDVIISSDSSKVEIKRKK